MKDKFKFDPFGLADKKTVDVFGVQNQGVKKKSKKNEGDIIWRKLTDKDRAGYSKHIKPINAEIIQDFIPQKDEFSFMLMNGNCNFSDFILQFNKKIAPISESIFTTLSLNEKTFDVLDTIPGDKYLLVSTYFLATDKADTLPKLNKQGRLTPYQIGFYRNHTKMCLIKTSDENHYVFAGSANLRSSGTIEQFVIFNDKTLYDFNRNWILKLIDKYNFKKCFDVKNIKSGSAKFENFLNADDFL